MRNTLLLFAVALYAVACASGGASSRPSTQPSSQPSSQSSSQGNEKTALDRVTPAPPPAHVDAEELRKELENAYEHILSRTDGAEEALNEAPLVDFEAAASIPIPEHRTINSAVRLFSGGMKENIQASLLRSARYKNLIEKDLAERRLPKGLAYLPVIESAYDATLTSRSGAHGMWQFMPGTAREYGLRVDWWVDERADPERSTRAAVAYLDDLHRMFDDWSLALAAYNCGPGRVRRTLDAAGATTFWELLEAGRLPKETRGYVPTFYATLLIASDPETYGFELGKPPAEDDRAESERVELRGPLSLAYVAETIGMPEESLREMNPALRRGVVPPGRESVIVPKKAAPYLIAHADTLRDDDAYVKYCSFKLRKGDSVKKLARAVGTKPEKILAMNCLTSAKSLRAGNSIYLPLRARDVGSILAYSNDPELFYRVRKGDTLYAIARRHGLSVSELREMNELRKNAVLRIGQKLRISGPRVLSAGGGM